VSLRNAALAALLVGAAGLSGCSECCRNVANQTKWTVAGAAAGAVTAVFTFDDDALKLFVGDRQIGPAAPATVQPAKP
jgi:hypothetical protein